MDRKKYTAGWVDGWMGGWVDGWMMDGWMPWYTGGQMDRRMEADRGKDNRMDAWMETGKFTTFCSRKNAAYIPSAVLVTSN